MLSQIESMKHSTIFTSVFFILFVLGLISIGINDVIINIQYILQYSIQTYSIIFITMHIKFNSVNVSKNSAIRRGRIKCARWECLYWEFYQTFIHRL